jgi:hypothetical protein
MEEIFFNPSVTRYLASIVMPKYPSLSFHVFINLSQKESSKNYWLCSSLLEALESVPSKV